MKRIGLLVLALIMLVSNLPFSQPVKASEIRKSMNYENEKTEFTGYIPITTKADLYNVSNNPSGYYYLTNDIIFTEEDFLPEQGEYYNGGNGWTPIGGGNYRIFDGVFDGNGYSIKGVQVNSSQQSGRYFGVFGINRGQIRNLNVTDTKIIGRINSSMGEYSGGIVGENQEDGRIENCSFSGEVQAYWAGGIAGSNGGTITNCSNEGRIKAQESGGIAGNNYGLIEKSYNASNQSYLGDNYSNLGAFAGIAWQNYGTITECYNVGNIRGSSSIVGITELNRDTGTIKNCFNIGTLQSESLASGIVNLNQGTVEDCYNAGVIMDVSDSNGGYAYAGIAINSEDGNSVVRNVYNMGRITSKHSNTIAPIVQYGTVKNAYYLLEDGENYYPEKKGTALTYEQSIDKSYYGGFDFDGVWEITAGQMPKLRAIVLDTSKQDVVIKDHYLGLNESINLEYFMVGSNYFGARIGAITVQDPSIISIEEGRIFGKKYGETAVRISFVFDGKVVDKTIQVYVKKLVEQIQLSHTEANLAINDSIQILATVYPKEVKPKLAWKSLDETVAKVDENGLIKAVGHGKTMVTVTAEDGSQVVASVKIAVLKTTNINLSKEPKKIYYQLGEPLELDQATIVYYLQDGNSSYGYEREITMDMVSGYEKDKPGKQEVTVTFDGCTTTFSIYVGASLKLVSPPNKVVYRYGDFLDLNGGKIQIVYSNGFTTMVNLSECHMIGYDSRKVGTQIVTAYYKGLTVNFEVEVENYVSRISVDTLPNKVNYYAGESFDVTGGMLTIHYVDGTASEIQLKQEMISNFDTNLLGTQTIYVLYNNFMTTFKVSVTKKRPPVITGITNGAYYNKDVKPVISDGTALLNGKPYRSGTVISDTGNYKLEVTDHLGNKTSATFYILKNKPIIKGIDSSNKVITSGTITKSSVKVSYSAAITNNNIKSVKVVKDKKVISWPSNGTFQDSGSYEIVVEDKASNTTKYTFVIDKIVPIIKLTDTKNSNMKSGSYSNRDIKVTVSDSNLSKKTVTKDGKVIAWPAKSIFTSNGKYEISATDKAGNVKKATFCIDKVAPSIKMTDSKNKSLKNGAYTNKTVKLTYSDVNISKVSVLRFDKKYSFPKGGKFTAEGSYQVTVLDKAGNKSIYKFIIDKKAPSTPSIGKVTVKSKTVVGSAEKGTQVFVKVGSKTYKGTVNNSGKYFVKIPVQKVKTKVSVYVQDKAGNKSKTKSIFVVKK